MSFTSVKICELERWVSPNPSQGLICPQSSSCNFIQSAAFGEGGAQGEMVLGFLTRFILDQIKMVKIPQFFFRERVTYFTLCPWQCIAFQSSASDSPLTHEEVCDEVPSTPSWRQ